MVINSVGHLRIRDLRVTDEGLYVCVATNLAGSRESRPVRLKVLSKYRSEGTRTGPRNKQ